MLIHGVVITIGLALFGVPNSILWGTAAAFAAFIPGIGTGLVAIPSIIFLLAIGAVPQALGLFVWWSVGAVGIVDNVISPKLVGKGMHVHPLLVLLAITGGILFFGIAGVLLGPLVISLLLALVSVYIDPKTA
jgi:predicted PurR-regulated permease PerM